VRARPAGTVCVDYLQNIGGKTVAAAWCVRAKPGATVSTPLAWEALDDDLDPRAFTIETVPARAKRQGDGWAKAMKATNALEALPGKRTGRAGARSSGRRTGAGRAPRTTSARAARRR
jgi:DNA primase